MRSTTKKEPAKGADVFPPTFGACADKLYALREKRLAAQKAVAAIQEEETALTNYIIENLPKTDGGAVGKKARVLLVKKDVPQVNNWEALYEFIRKKKRFDLLQRRVSVTAVAEMWENGVPVPGVQPFTVLSLSTTKK